MLALATTAFIRRSFYEECRSADEPWVMARADRWALAGRSPFLNEQEIRADNGGRGLLCLIANWMIFPDDPGTQLSLYSELTSAWMNFYRGSRVAMVIAEPVRQQYIDRLKHCGFTVVNNYQLIPAPRANFRPR